MTASKSLSNNPSLEYERKQAKALVKAVKHKDATAIARVRNQLPACDLPISLSQAQLVLAREYGYSGWPELKDAILDKLGRGIEVAYRDACAAIDANDVDRLSALTSEFPELLTHRQPESPEVLLLQTTSYANFPGAENEEHYNRLECAEFLLNAGAIVDPRVFLRLMDTGAHKMLALFERKAALPENLRVFAALGDLARVSASFDSSGKLLDSAHPSQELLDSYDDASAEWPAPGKEIQIIADAFLYACRLGHREVAEALLERSVALDADLGQRIEHWQGRDAFIDFLLARVPEGARHGTRIDLCVDSPGVIWQHTVLLRLQQAQEEPNEEAFRELLAHEPSILEAHYIETQVRILEVAAYSENAKGIIAALLESGAAIAQASPPPKSHAISWAIEYGNSEYVPLLSQVWDVPDDLPHAAGLGNLTNVNKWFDAAGQAQIQAAQHNVFTEHTPKVSVQEILDRALAWAVINRQYEISDFLLDHGADINTRWGTHEPASILHECAFDNRLEQVKYLVEKGIDLTIKDFRHQSTAEGWARYGGQDLVAEFLANAQQEAKESS